MSRKSWQVIPGEGPRCLDRVSDDIALWQRNAQSLNALYSESEYWRVQGDAAITNVVEEALVDGAISKVTESALQLDEQYKREIIRASVSKMALARLESLTEGTAFDVEHKRARITIAGPGVKLNTLISGPNGFFGRRRRDALPGETFEGTAHDFMSTPPVGGRLQIGQWYGMLIIRGLVDPVELLPRVELDILGKF